MREIKFRAWDGKIMVYTDWNSWRNWYNESKGGKVVYGRGGIIETMLSKPMQYTGLKDKNGVEIYEGDWISTKNGIGYVVWDDAAFAIKSPGSEAVDWEHSSVFESSEVVGNIYETPNY